MASILFIFGLFKQTVQILQQINVKKWPYIIQRRDSNKQASVYKSTTLTTRPAFPPNLIFFCSNFCSDIIKVWPESWATRLCLWKNLLVSSAETWAEELKMEWWRPHSQAKWEDSTEPWSGLNSTWLRHWNHLCKSNLCVKTDLIEWI